MKYELQTKNVKINFEEEEVRKKRLKGDVNLRAQTKGKREREEFKWECKKKMKEYNRVSYLLWKAKNENSIKKLEIINGANT